MIRKFKVFGFSHIEPQPTPGQAAEEILLWPEWDDVFGKKTRGIAVGDEDFDIRARELVKTDVLVSGPPSYVWIMLGLNHAPRAVRLCQKELEVLFPGATHLWFRTFHEDDPDETVSDWW